MQGKAAQAQHCILHSLHTTFTDRLFYLFGFRKTLEEKGCKALTDEEVKIQTFWEGKASVWKLSMNNEINFGNNTRWKYVFARDWQDLRLQLQIL